MQNSMKIGLLGLYVYSFFLFPGHVGASLGIVLMLIGVSIQWKDAIKILPRDPLFIISMLFLAFVWLNAGIAAHNLPETIDAQINEAQRWSRLSFAFLIAWFIRGSRKVIYTSLALILTGFFVREIVYFDLNTYHIAFNGGRTGFTHGINRMGEISSTLLIGMIALSSLIVSKLTLNKKYLFLILVWVGLLSIIFWYLFTTQSRGSWLAATIGLAAIIIGTLLIKSLSLKWITPSVLAIILLASFNIETIKHRIITEHDVLTNIITMKSVDDLPTHGSIATRFHMINFAFKRWMEKPLTGWGPGTIITTQFIDRNFTDPLDAMQAQHISSYGHLHNAYVTVLAQLGLLGAMFFLSIYYLTVSNIYKAYKQDTNNQHLLIFFISVFCVQLILYLTHARFAFIGYQMMFIYLIGAAYSFRYCIKNQDSI